MPQDTPSRKLDQYIVRFPDGMRDRIRQAAEVNNRSMNAEIVARLEASFSSDLLTDARLEYKKVDRLLQKIEELLEEKNQK